MVKRKQIRQKGARRETGRKVGKSERGWGIAGWYLPLARGEESLLFAQQRVSPAAEVPAAGSSEHRYGHAPVLAKKRPLFPVLFYLFGVSNACSEWVAVAKIGSEGILREVLLHRRGTPKGLLGGWNG